MARRRIIIAVLIIVSFLLQTTFFKTLPFITVTPNILLVLTALFGLMRGQRDGMLTGLACGILVDLFFGPVMGVYALIYMYIGFGCGFFNKIFYPGDFKLPLIMIASSDFIYGIVIYFFMFLFRNRTGFDTYLIRIIFPELVFTIIIGLILYFPLRALNYSLEEHERKVLS